MLFNPFKYQYEATYLSDEQTEAWLLLRKGTQEEKFRFPRSFLPVELKVGDHFILNLQSENALRESEEQALKKLLEELIR